jgi:PAS domain S-box-containing protein
MTTVIVLAALVIAAALAAFVAAQFAVLRRAARRRDEAQLLHALIEGTSDAVFVKDLEGRYLIANDTAAALIGHPREAIVGSTDADLCPAAQAAARRARDEAVLAAGETRRYWRTETDLGIQRSLSVVKAPYRDRDGKTVGLIGIVRDEIAMRRLEEEAGRFFDLAPDMLCTVGPDGYLERVNESWSAVLGWTADELRARPLLDFVHPDDRAAAAGQLELMLAGRIDGCVHRLATRSGGWRDVEWTARVVPEDERAYAVVRDVTDRNHIESALAASEARYRVLVHSLPNSSVVTFDHDLRFTFAAGAALSEAGLDGDVVGRTLPEVLPHVAATLTPRYRATLGGHPQSFELSGRDGRHYWVQMAPLRDGDGAIEGGMVLAQNITALRAAERELSQFRAWFEQTPIGMSLISLDGRYLRVNDALCRLTGYDAEQLLETTVDAITHPEDTPHDAAAREDMMAGRISSLRIEKRYVHAAGHTVPVSVHATLVRDADGNPSHILGQVQDVSAR